MSGVKINFSGFIGARQRGAKRDRRFLRLVVGSRTLPARAMRGTEAKTDPVDRRLVDSVFASRCAAA